MFRVEGNMESMFVNFLSDIDLTETNLEETLRHGAVDSIAIISHRIQQQGESAEGNRIQTKALLRSGAYSKAYAKRRAEKGRQIQQVDMTNSGDLMRNFQVLSVSPRLVTAGFLNNKQADIADHQEAYYGEDIWALSNSEQQFVADGMAYRVIDDLGA